MKVTFWDRTAKIYDHFMKKDHKAYKQMYSLIYPVVRHKQCWSWQPVQQQYVSYLSDWRTNLGGKKNFHNSTGALMIVLH